MEDIIWMPDTLNTICIKCKTYKQLEKNDINRKVKKNFVFPSGKKLQNLDRFRGCHCQNCENHVELKYINNKLYINKKEE
jgi:hypothetical protein